MSNLMTVVCVAAMFALVSDGWQAAKPVVRTPYVCYDVLDRAYSDGHRIEPGMTRRQVEEKWYEDGGI